LISTKLRLQLEEICQRIELGQEVSFYDMNLIQKCANTNRTVYDMLQRSRRRAAQGTFQKGSLDEFLDQMNIGNPDPQTHITGESSIDDLANFFKSDNDHMRRD
jgi:succinylglutamate desuccinylase